MPVEIIATACFITLRRNRYSDQLLPLLGQFVLTPNRINKLMDLRMNCPHIVSSAGIWSLPGDLCLFSFSPVIWTSQALGSGTSGSAVCISFYLISLTACTFSSWEKWFLCIAIILWECVTRSPFLSLTILVLVLVPFLFFLKCLLASCLTLFRLSTFLCIL